MKIYLKKKNILAALGGLLFASPVFCQEQLSGIESAFAEYQKQNLEKVFVHTDKDFYLAGDLVWFKLYVVDGESNKPLDISKVAYVEIISKDQKPLLQTKIAINEGSGNGSIHLPASTNSGIYTLRAYTNWMKNFGSEYYFEKPITIVNSLKTLSVESSEETKYDVQFFPEGGHMVAGIQSRVAFKIVDQKGRGVDGDGFVLSPANDTLARFHPLKFGMGNFFFTPSTESGYKAVIKVADTMVTKELPNALTEGYVLKLDPLDDQLQLTVTTNIKSSGFVYLFVHTKEAQKIAERITLTDGAAKFTIEKSKLGEGISHFTIFDGQYQPVCERLFFTSPKRKLFIRPSINQQEAASRKKITLTFSSSDELEKPQSAEVSIAVYKIDSIQRIQDAAIDNYFWLTSELAGNIESPGYYFSQQSAEVEAAADNLMLTQGWRRFTWQNILQRPTPGYAFLPEYKGHIVYARVRNANTGAPAVGVVTYLSIPGPRVQLYDSKSDSSGIVRFYTKDFYGPAEIVLQTDSTSNISYKVEIINPFSDKFSNSKAPSITLEENMKNLLSDYSVGTQVQNNFFSEKLKRFHIPDVDSSAFFGNPDIQYLLDNYTRFSTMEEVLREYVYEVLVRRQRENFRFIVSDVDNKIFLNDPLTLFNGVPVFDPNKIIRYDPLKVKRIEIVKRKFFYGPAVFNGIVNFVTYTPDASMISEVSPAILEYEGLQYQREFYSPVYETQDQVSSRLPDFRNVLYWSPNVQTSIQGKVQVNFFTSDVKGKYVAILQGISRDGRVGTGSVFFNVK